MKKEKELALKYIDGKKEIAWEFILDFTNQTEASKTVYKDLWERKRGSSIKFAMPLVNKYFNKWDEVGWIDRKYGKREFVRNGKIVEAKGTYYRLNLNFFTYYLKEKYNIDISDKEATKTLLEFKTNISETELLSEIFLHKPIVKFLHKHFMKDESIPEFFTIIMKGIALFGEENRELFDLEALSFDRRTYDRMQKIIEILEKLEKFIGNDKKLFPNKSCISDRILAEAEKNKLFLKSNGYKKNEMAGYVFGEFLMGCKDIF